MGVDSKGLRTGMEKVYQRYQLPMIITENGMAVSETPDESGKIDDHYRIDYLHAHLEQIYRMLQEGIHIMGYCPWSFVDVLSSHQGFSKRYGLVYVDRTETDPKQCSRIRKNSFYWYQNVIRCNGIE